MREGAEREGESSKHDYGPCAASVTWQVAPEASQRRCHFLEQHLIPSNSSRNYNNQAATMFQSEESRFFLKCRAAAWMAQDAMT